MIEVDEENFLIVTDIDRLMHLVATQRRVELGKLAKELKMNPREVEKWLHILEDEGLITIEHSLTKVYAVWAGEAAPRPEKKREERPAPRREQKLPPAVVEEKDEEEEKEEEEKFRPFTTEEIAPLEEELLEFREREERRAAKQPAREARKPWEAPKEPEAVVEPEEEEPAPRREMKPIHREEKHGRKPSVAPVQIKVSDYTKLPQVEAASLKDKLDDYLTLIRESKKELKDLESEKERMYREGYLPLEKEFEAGLENIQLAILEKERKIMEAKEKAAGLPEQVEELEKLQRAVREVEQKSKAILSKTKGQVEVKADALHDASEELGEQISLGEEEAMRERAKMFELKELLGSIQSNEENIREAIEENRKSMDEAKSKIEQLEDSLGDVVDARTLLGERIDTIQSGLERKIKSLDELKKDMEEIERVEGWFKEYSQDYARKLEELEAYVANNQQEIGKLMEAAELEYVKKYLEKLSESEDKYRDKLHILEIQDTELEQRISEAKERIRQLLTESTHLMEASRKKAASSTFDTSDARKKMEGKAAVLEEKSKERKGLFDAITKGKEGRDRKKK
ncbi:MAG: hypothetical protein WC350_03130 [Candidatus Micrarchaeia archaeon]|jgi:chromosome segregation ATPase